MHQTRPLTGIRVLELGAYISGPYATALMAALGADVIKIEPPNGGDAFRRAMDIGSHYFVQYNAGKKSVAVNLKRSEGVALIRALASSFDVVVDNNRPGKMAALGLGAKDLMNLNPSLVYTSVSGFGDGGPWRDRAAYDSIGQSMGGFYSIMNDEGEARLSGTCVGDLIGALTAAMGILAGLVGRAQSPERKGFEIQTSLVEAMSTITIDAMTQFFETGVSPTRQSRLPQAQNFCVATASGGSITLHLSSSQKFWEALAGAMGRADLIGDQRFKTYYDRMANYFELKPIVDAAFLAHSREEWEAMLIEADVPFSPTLSVEEVIAHPQTEWLDMLEPAHDGKTLVRPPWRFFGQRPDRPFRAPHIGEHTREVASQVLSAAEVDWLIAEGVLSQAAASEDGGLSSVRVD